MNRFATLTTIIVLAAATLGGISISRRHLAPQPSGVVASRAAPKAFGELSTSTITASRSAGQTDAASAASGRAEPSPAVIAPASLYRYVYRGDPLTLTSGTVDVLERMLPSQPAVRVTGFDLGLLDPRTFSGATVQTLSITQDSGYAIYVDAQNGTVSINEVLSDIAVREAAKPTTTPPDRSDAEIIGVARSFLADHGIAQTGYGTPEVVHQSNVVTLDTPATMLLKPEIAPMTTATVLYPLTVDGRGVYTAWGERQGLSVSVDLQRMRVTGLFNLATQRYRASPYPAEGDATKIIAVAERGGVYGSPIDAGTETKELTLMTPSPVLLALTMYENNRNRDLLVPALQFLVKDPPTGYPLAVVVPLAKDLLLQPEIKPLPLPAEGSGSSGSAGSAPADPGITNR